MFSTKFLIIIIVLLLLITYSQYYTSFNKGYRIIQTQLHNIDDKVLYEKYPIIIQERIVHPDRLLNTLFKYMYSFKERCMVKGSDLVYMTPHKFSLIYNEHADMDVNIISPVFKSAFAPFVTYQKCMPRSQTTTLDRSSVEYITIKLKQKQVIILPYSWLYQTTKDHSVMFINDLFSQMISLYKRSS